MTYKQNPPTHTSAQTYTHTHTHPPTQAHRLTHTHTRTHLPTHTQPPTHPKSHLSVSPKCEAASHPLKSSPSACIFYWVSIPMGKTFSPSFGRRRTSARDKVFFPLYFFVWKVFFAALFCKIFTFPIWENWFFVAWTTLNLTRKG